MDFIVEQKSHVRFSVRTSAIPVIMKQYTVEYSWNQLFCIHWALALCKFSTLNGYLLFSFTNSSMSKLSRSVEDLTASDTIKSDRSYFQSNSFSNTERSTMTLPNRKNNSTPSPFMKPGDKLPPHIAALAQSQVIYLCVYQLEESGGRYLLLTIKLVITALGFEIMHFNATARSRFPMKFDKQLHRLRNLSKRFGLLMSIKCNLKQNCLVYFLLGLIFDISFALRFQWQIICSTESNNLLLQVKYYKFKRTTSKYGF